MPRRSNNVTLPKEIGAAGEVKQPVRAEFDLPRRALFKVARHFVEGRSDPSSKEGIEPSLQFAHSFA